MSTKLAQAERCCMFVIWMLWVLPNVVVARDRSFQRIAQQRKLPKGSSKIFFKEAIKMPTEDLVSCQFCLWSVYQLVPEPIGADQFRFVPRIEGSPHGHASCFGNMKKIDTAVACIRTHFDKTERFLIIPSCY